MELPPSVREFLARDHKLLIGGEWVDAADGATFETLDPATGQVLATVPAGDTADVDRAVAAARRAFRDAARKHIGPSERGQLVWRLADLIEEHAEEFAVIDSLDNGKPVSAARAAEALQAGTAGSTPTTSMTRRCPSAASSSRAGAARWATPCSTITPRPRPSAWSCRGAGCFRCGR